MIFCHQLALKPHLAGCFWTFDMWTSFDRVQAAHLFFRLNRVGTLLLENFALCISPFLIIALTVGLELVYAIVKLKDVVVNA